MAVAVPVPAPVAVPVPVPVAVPVPGPLAVPVLVPVAVPVVPNIILNKLSCTTPLTFLNLCFSPQI